jgi:hypothetical protein
MEEPLTELAGYFRQPVPPPDTDLLKLVSAARTAGHRWSALATACQPGAGIEESAGLLGTGAAARLFRQVCDVCEATRHGPPSWRCPDCRHPVTDPGPLGRPAHVELGHAAACTRLARDQAADDQERRSRIPALITGSEPARGPLQRHRLGRRFVDDCPAAGGGATSTPGGKRAPTARRQESTWSTSSGSMFIRILIILGAAGGEVRPSDITSCAISLSGRVCASNG